MRLAIAAAFLLALVGCGPAQSPIGEGATHVGDETFSVDLPMQGTLRDKDFDGQDGSQGHLWILASREDGAQTAFVVARYDPPPGAQSKPLGDYARQLAHAIVQNGDTTLDGESIKKRGELQEVEYAVHATNGGAFGKLVVLFAPKHAFVMMFVSERRDIVEDPRVEAAFNSIAIKP